MGCFKKQPKGDSIKTLEHQLMILSYFIVEREKIKDKNSYVAKEI
jgi:hypothetical protein